MQPTTTGPRSGNSRFFASPPRTPRHNYARPASRLVSQKHAPGFFRSDPVPRARFGTSQATDERPACTIFSYQTASGCAVDPNNAGNIPAFGPAAPSKPPAPPGSLEVFVGLDGDLVGILGGEGAVGIVINFKNFTKSGVYGAIGPAAGANVGLSVNAGFARRGVEGLSFNVDANVGAVSPTVSFDADGFNGLAVGYGPGAGLSVSATQTGKYTLSDFGADVKRAWNWLF